MGEKGEKEGGIGMLFNVRGQHGSRSTARNFALASNRSATSEQTRSGIATGGQVRRVKGTVSE
jgi:hypothetical protein